MNSNIHTDMIKNAFTHKTGDGEEHQQDERQNREENQSTQQD